MTVIKKRFHRYGLIGHPLGHSLSPLIHQRIMEAAGIDGKYQLYDIAPERLGDELPHLLKSLDGFNCTIPHKLTIIPYLRDLAPSARLYGAVNTVFSGHGHNTDGAGFAACGVDMAGRHVCVTGSGGVSRVLAMEAARAGAAQIVVDARNQRSADALVNHVRAAGYDAIRTATTHETKDSISDVILNGTPVGIWPNAGGLSVSMRRIRQAQAVFDTIYNPTATRLVLKAKSQGIPAMGGLRMLFEQALAAQRIWNPTIDFDRAKEQLSRIPCGLAREVLRKSPIKLLLTGFMGSGKSYIGRQVSMTLGGDLPFVDLDAVVAQRAGKSISQIFAAEGEAAFRALERQCLLEQLHASGSTIIATGGGALVQPGAAEVVHAGGALVIYLDTPFATSMRR
ncbi:MAG TPA: hypothetical protein DDZ53_09810, partial [Firmicutes bacterium]|nr:hypothetical protein [Bacillota bacterium]